MIVTAIILAGGTGERFGADLPKQFIKLAGEPIIAHTLDAFQGNHLVDKVVIVVNSEHLDFMRGIVKEGRYDKVSAVVPGGSTRQASSLMGLKACAAGTTHVLIHDAVRPFVDDDIITKCVEGLHKYEAIDVCVESVDTIVEVDDHAVIRSIPPRSKLRRGQTPQAFRYATIMKAHEMAIMSGVMDSTDDCNLLLRSGLAPVHTIDGSDYNIKITHPVDIHMAEKIFQLRMRRLYPMSIPELAEHLSGRVLVVFGGNSGIGKSICDLGGRCEAVMVPLSRSNGVDITISEQVKKALESVHGKYGRIDGVLICSAIMHQGKLMEIKDDEMIDQVNTNLIGNILVAKHAIPHLLERHGKIVFFASSSYTRGREGYAVYSATKSAIVNLMQALADELSRKVDVIAINPQRTSTPLRQTNFGEEDPQTLLTPQFVALQTLTAMVSNYTGCVIDITLSDEMKYAKRDQLRAPITK